MSRVVSRSSDGDAPTRGTYFIFNDKPLFDLQETLALIEHELLHMDEGESVMIEKGSSDVHS